jgi:hypothetical protein
MIFLLYSFFWFILFVFLLIVSHESSYGYFPFFFDSPHAKTMQWNPGRYVHVLRIVLVNWMRCTFNSAMLWNSKCSEWNLIVFYIPALHPFTISKLGCCFVVLNTIWSCQLIRPLVRGMTCWSLFSTCVVQFIVSSRRSWGYIFCGGSDSELWMTLQTLFLIVIAHTPSYVWFRCKKGLERWVFLTTFSCPMNGSIDEDGRILGCLFVSCNL